VNGSRTPTFVALLLSVALVAASCQGASAPAGSGQAPLMNRLALEGDRDLFDARYVGLVGSDAVIFVGTKGAEAVAYLCDPAAGSRWFTGTSADGKLDLRDAKGGRLTGPVTAATFDATLSGIAGYDGAVTLPAAGPEARLVREQGVPSGQLVGGLVFDGDVIRGVFTVNASGTIKPGIASIPAGTNFAIGVRSTAGPRIDLTISTNPRLDHDKQTQAEKEMRAAEDMVKAQKEAATMGFMLAVVCAAVAVSMAGVGAVAAVGAAAVTALKQGKLSDLDPTANAFLSNALKDIVEGLQVTVGTPRPGATGSAQPVTLGTVTFGSFSGGL
jgi:hypothetical protein